MTVPRAGGTGAGGATVDLHAHTTASDGSRSPTELVRAAREAGLAAIAVTDHDTLAGVDEALREGESVGVRVVPGAELSATDGTREWHILALHVSDRSGLDQRLAVYRESRLERAERIAARLTELGLPVTYQEVLSEAGAAAVGRPHVARVMIRRGYVRDHREAFDRWLGNGRPAFVHKLLISVADACLAIHDAGALAILAHPGSDGRRSRIEALVAAGLDGLEVRHPSHTSEDERRLSSLVQEFGLVMSGGSDWHGNEDGGRRLDAMQVPMKWLEQQDARVALRAGR